MSAAKRKPSAKPGSAPEADTPQRQKRQKRKRAPNTPSGKGKKAARKDSAGPPWLIPALVFLAAVAVGILALIAKGADPH